MSFLSHDNDRRHDVSIEINEESATFALESLHKEHLDAKRHIHELEERLDALTLTLPKQRPTPTREASIDSHTTPPNPHHLPQFNDSLHYKQPSLVQDPVSQMVSRAILANMLPPRFSGGIEDSPVIFLQCLNDLTSTYNISVEQMKGLLTGALHSSAAMWWRNVRDHLYSTTDIIHAFRTEFISDHYILAILAQIQNTRQDNEESCTAFIERVVNLYIKLPTGKPDQEIIQQILMAANPFISLHLGGKQYASLGELKAEALRIDNNLRALLLEYRDSSLCND